ncbi:DUF1523 family protein [Frigidibacter sp. ROC022]|uniref:DUF1523 family protein n=1 Tax=Frigidibacter sp. ROC022 TaxID=2971796 RepID=UPI00215B2577|nr:DUF1523 family protein [Frigidibacter sp. ROC022]MCR8724172.1 DUF1523 family protein [Frigidibacter sp. ROC022]
MWRKIKWGIRIVVALILVAFFHYVLPQHDVVRVTGTEVIRTDFTAFNRLFYAQADAGNAEGTTRDIRLIYAVRDGDRVIVYRNEDTGTIWPPYFKFDSSNLQAEAQDLQSTKANPQWVIMTHYGWRIPFLSIYPNAVGIKAVDGPDVRIIPWFNIFFFLFLGFVVLLVRRMIAQFRERTVDPMLEDAGEVWDRVDDHADAAADKAKGIWGGFTAWLGTWKGKPRVPRK